jgi:acetyl esterase/lipase
MTERAYDPELLELIALLPTTVDWPEPEAMPAFREQQSTFYPTADPHPDVTREERRVPGADGHPDVPVILYRPRTASSERRPGVLEIHGGGFITGTAAQMHPWCDQVAADLGAVVCSVDYRLAPEHPYPAGIEDCYAALAWFAANADHLGIDPDRIAIAGQSAGGGLAAGTALLARDRGGPALCFQLLEIPELDHRLETPSMTAFVDTPLWNRPNAIVSWTWYLGPDFDGPGSEGVPVYASPSLADDLSGLPPSFVSVMEFDPLRDEGLDYAARLLQAGVSTELHAYPGTFHGSTLVQSAAISKQCNRDAFGALARALTR